MITTNKIKWLIFLSSIIWMPWFVFYMLGTENYMPKLYDLYLNLHTIDVVGLVERHWFKLLISLNFDITLAQVFWLKPIVEWIKNRE